MAKFYVCETCGNLVGMVHASGVPMMCCGKKMTELVPGTVEASKEKHIPVATVEDGKVIVNVGSVDHPMTEEHLIEWVYLETCCGGQVEGCQLSFTGLCKTCLPNKNLEGESA